jgi:hypothetical protein
MRAMPVMKRRRWFTTSDGCMPSAIERKGMGWFTTLGAMPVVIERREIGRESSCRSTDLRVKVEPEDECDCFWEWTYPHLIEAVRELPKDRHSSQIAMYD